MHTHYMRKLVETGQNEKMPFQAYRDRKAGFVNVSVETNFALLRVNDWNRQEQRYVDYAPKVRSVRFIYWLEN